MSWQPVGAAQAGVQLCNAFTANAPPGIIPGGPPLLLSSRAAGTRTALHSDCQLACLCALPRPTATSLHGARFSVQSKHLCPCKVWQPAAGRARSAPRLGKPVHDISQRADATRLPTRACLHAASKSTVAASKPPSNTTTNIHCTDKSGTGAGTPLLTSGWPAPPRGPARAKGRYLKVGYLSNFGFNGLAGARVVFLVRCWPRHLITQILPA